MRRDHSRRTPWAPLCAGVLATIGVALAIHASYPGYLNPDSFGQLKQILTGHYDDWHSPFIALVWSALLQVFPGPVGFIVADNLLIWGSLALIAAVMSRMVGASALLLVTVPALPGVVNFLGNVHKDAMLAAWMLAGFASAFWGQSGNASAGMQRTGRYLANAFAVAAFLTRPNAIFATIPLLLYANSRLGRWRNLLACAVLLALMPATLALQNRMLGVEVRHAGDSIKTYHLLGISYFAGKNLFPGKWAPAQSDAILHDCYSPIQWDNAAPWGSCGFIHHELATQGIWGTSSLTRAWLGALLGHPLEAYSTMAAMFRLSMREPNSRAMFYDPPKSALINWQVETNPPRDSTAMVQDYVRSPFNDELSRPWVFVVMFGLSVTALLGANLAATRPGLLAASVVASGATYLLTYFPFNVSAEYRYFYWCGFAAYLGLLATAMAFLARHGAGLHGQTLPRAARVGLSALVALALALVVAPFKLPTAPQMVRITPLDNQRITLTQLRTASIPVWMWHPFEGGIDAPGWHMKNDVLFSGEGAMPLTATVTTLHQDIRIKLKTGPGGGRARIEGGKGAQVVDTYSETAGELAVDVAASGELEHMRRRVSLLTPARVALGFAVLMAAFLWLGRRSRR